jgi:hypothetical protein
MALQTRGGRRKVSKNDGTRGRAEIDAERLMPDASAQVVSQSELRGIGRWGD